MPATPEEVTAAALANWEVRHFAKPCHERLIRYFFTLQVEDDSGWHPCEEKVSAEALRERSGSQVQNSFRWCRQARDRYLAGIGEEAEQAQKQLQPQ